MTINPLITRRDLLRSAAAAAVGVCVGPALARALEPAAAAPSKTQGVLVDLTRCIGCRACERACQARNHLPKDSAATTAWEGGARPLTFDRWTVVNLVGGAPVKRQCLHCLEPACASVCPVGALRRTDRGAVVYRQERCIGCRYCLFACPFGAPKFEWDSGMTPVVGKCQLCAQHADAAGPACAAACPTGALKAGPRDALLREARARIQARPDRYLPHIYGEHEVGGTAWLYISSVPFETAGFPSRLPTIGLPRLTWVALKMVPTTVTVLAVVLGAVSLGLRPRAEAAP